MNKKQFINIIDPNLSELNFYNYKFYHTLKNYKKKKLKIFCNKKISSSILKKKELHPKFNLDLNPRVLKNYKKKYFKSKKQFLSDLNNIDIKNGPILLYNTTLPYIDALTEWQIKKKYSSNLYIEYPTILNKAINDDLIFEKNRCKMIKNRIKKNNKVFFITHFEFSKKRIYQLFSRPVIVAKLPLNMAMYNIKKKINKKKIILSFIGEQRTNKGLNFLKEIIINLNSKKYNFFVHNPKNSKRLNNLVKKKLNTKIEETFNLKNWIKFINKSDIVIFPYNPNRYKYGYSGSLIDAILLEKICIVPDETVLSSIISKKLKRFSFFSKWESKNISNTITKVFKNLNKTKNLFQLNSKDFILKQKRYPKIIDVVK